MIRVMKLLSASALGLALSAPVPAQSPAFDAGRPPGPAGDAGDAGREDALRRQADLWTGLETGDPVRTMDRDREALSEILAIEDRLFGGGTHVSLAAWERLATLTELRQPLPETVQRARREALAIAARCFGARPRRGAAGAADTPPPEEARPFQQAIDTRGRLLGPDHPLVALTLVDLALAQAEQGRSDLALATLEKARPVPFRASPLGLSNDQQFHRDLMRLSAGTREDMHRLLAESTAAFEKSLAASQQHGDEAVRSEAKGDRAAALKSWSLALGGFQAAGSGYILSESTQLALAERFRGVTDRCFSFLSRGAAREPHAVAGLYFGLSNLKGSIYTHLRRIRLERRHPALRPLFDEYEGVVRSLAAASARAGPGLDDRLRLARKAALEAEAARRHGRMAAMMNVPPRGQLAPGTALADYIVFERTPVPGDADRAQAGPHLACILCRPDAQEAFVSLGPMAPVTDAIRGWRRAILRRAGGSARGVVRIEPGEDPNEVPQDALRRLIWEPLVPHLGGTKTVLISADGVLAEVPFAALPGAANGSYLLEAMSVAIAPIPRLIRPLPAMWDMVANRDGLWTTATRTDQAEGLCLVGDVDFDAAPGLLAGREPAASSGPEPARMRREASFPPLPGTAREVEEIGDLFRRLTDGRPVRSLTGARATEGVVRRLASETRYLHLATHGYFANGAAPKDDPSPELRSAVVLAGADLQPRPEEDDGILTALEVASLDLDKVELVVLSACETGLGQDQLGEGVLGLQRAFMLAGAKATVTSLWQVDDDATRILMVEFYRNLLERKLGKLESLRQAQIAMMRGELHRPPGFAPGRDAALPPYYWAAFQLGGEVK